jgi:hypothetical protein
MDGNGDPLAECIQFADGFSWGSVRTADIKIAGEQANALRVQVIGDTAFATVPSDCASAGVPENTVQSFGANGLLGVGVFREDCGAFCVTATGPGTYYACPLTGCVGVVMPLAEQVLNPVVRFATNNNGVIVELPIVGAAGAASAKGSLVFGIGTQSNNGLGAATSLSLDVVGEFTTQYKAQSFARSFIDSGSNALFFPDATMTPCTGTTAAGFYCPARAADYSATLQSGNGANKDATFTVANAETLLSSHPNFWAFGSIAGANPVPQSFDWGLPFFFGRNVYVAIEGQSAPGGAGPYFAF